MLLVLLKSSLRLFILGIHPLFGAFFGMVGGKPGAGKNLHIVRGDVDMV
jgi:hypothetical protein